MLKELDYTLTLTGIAETKEQAFQQILQQIKSNVMKEFSDVVIRIEPKDIEVILARETSYVERFLGLLFPRRRTRYEITANVTTRLSMVELSKIEFQSEQEVLSPAQHVLRLR